MQPMIKMLESSGQTTKMVGRTQIESTLKDAAAIHVWNTGLEAYVKGDKDSLVYSSQYLLNSTFEKVSLLDESNGYILFINPEKK